MPLIIIKSRSEIEKMRKAGALAAETLRLAGEMVFPGQTTKNIDDFVHQYTIEHGAIPAPLNYRGFPKSCCTSINEVVCHGIPDEKVILQDGDIINIDITSILDGWHGDLSATFYVGKPSDRAIRLVETTRQCLEIGIAQVRNGARLGDIGAAISQLATSRGFSVVRDYVGHGIGRQFHEDLQVPHYGTRGRGPRLRTGMTFTIEPMINEGDWQTKVLPDKWTAVTRDSKWSAQFEHTLVVTETGCEILTAFKEPLPNSEPRKIPS